MSNPPNQFSHLISPIGGPRGMPPSKTRRQPNLVIANPDSDDDEEPIRSTLSGNGARVGHNLTLMTQPPTPGQYPPPGGLQRSGAYDQGISPLSGPSVESQHLSPLHIEQENGAYLDPYAPQTGSSGGGVPASNIGRPKSRAQTSPVYTSDSGPSPTFLPRQHSNSSGSQAASTADRSPASMESMIKGRPALSRSGSNVPSPSQPPSIPLPPPPTAEYRPDPIPSPLPPINTNFQHTPREADRRPFPSPSSGSPSFTTAPSASAIEPRPPAGPTGHSSNSAPEVPTRPSHSRTHPLPTLPLHATPGNVRLPNTRLAVTTNNEDFSVVDVTGVATSEAIMERVYSKLRFRDDDYPSLALYRTDIGETPESKPIGSPALFNLCQNQGDSKGTLKFLVLQTSVLSTPSASAVPPPSAASRAAHEYAGSSPIPRTPGPASLSSASNAERQRQRPRGQGHSSKGNSQSSAGDFLGGEQHTSPSPINSGPDGTFPHLGGEGDTELGNGAPSGLTRHHRMVSGRRLQGSTGSRSSRSPNDERRRVSAKNATSPPPTMGMLSSPAGSSNASNSGLQHNMDLMMPPPERDRRGSVTPTLPNPDLMQQAQASGLSYMRGNEPFASTSTSPPLFETGFLVNPSSSKQPARNMPEFWARSPTEPTEADLNLIQRIEQEERENQRRQQIQLEEDRKVAMMEQQKEHEVWEIMQAREREEQIRRAEMERVASENTAQLERERAIQIRREVERAEREREIQVGRERKERRQQWENKQQNLRAQGLNGIDTSDPSWPFFASGGVLPESGESTLLGRQGGNHSAASPVSPLDNTRMGPDGVGSGMGSSSGITFRYPMASQSRAPQYDPRQQQSQPFPPSTSSQPAGYDPVQAWRTEMHNAGAPRPRDRPQQFDGRRAAPQYQASQPPYNGPGYNPNVNVSPDMRAIQSQALPDQRPRHPYAAMVPNPSDSPLYGARSYDNMRRAGTSVPVPTPTGRQERTNTAGNIYPQQPADYYIAQDRRQAFYGQNQQVEPDTIYSDDRPRAWVPAPMPRPSTSQGAPGHRSGRSFDRQVSDGRDVNETILAWPEPQPGPLAFPEPVPYPAQDRRGSDGAVPVATDNQDSFRSRRASESRVPSFDMRGDVSPQELENGPEETLWMIPPQPSPSMTSPETSGSVRTITPSASMIRPDLSRKNTEEDGSGDTAKAGNWAKDLTDMMRVTTIDGDSTIMNQTSTLKPGPSAKADSPEESPEETLWFVPPAVSAALAKGANATSSSSVDRDSASSPARPSLRLDTHISADQSESSQPNSGEGTDPPSSLDSDDTEGTPVGVRRNKSFAKHRDQWNFRPAAEDVLHNLQDFFPKIDLDKPVLEAPLLDVTYDPTSPRTASPANIEEKLQARVPSRDRVPGFNRADARKSIRVVAENRIKHLSKIAPATKTQATGLERKRSSSMWGHRVVEVTPSRIKSGQIPFAIEESPASDGKPGTITWVKGELIGKGTYGRVYLAMNTTTGEMIAVKQVEMPNTEVERQDARQTSMIDALKSEIALLKDLEHPNVVQYLGWEDTPEFLSIFLEYVPGGSVASVYRKHKKFEEGVIKSFTKQILEGLAYLHACHILHRDLKADNILVDPAGIIKITDFGISKKTNDAYGSIISTNLKGSVFWMAPEVVHAEKGQGYSAKVDIWSLGCVVLEMWAGRRPWGDMEALAAMFQLASERKAPPIPEDVYMDDVALDFLNTRCFASKPRDRPTADELLSHRFITDTDPNWTFANSGIGRAIKK